MNFNIYIADEIGVKLMELSRIEHKSRNLIVREAIEFYLNQKNKEKWPDEIMAFHGEEDIEAFENLRNEMLPYKEKNLF